MSKPLSIHHPHSSFGQRVGGRQRRSVRNRSSGWIGNYSVMFFYRHPQSLPHSWSSSYPQEALLIIPERSSTWWWDHWLPFNVQERGRKRNHYIRNGIGFIYLEGDPPMHKGTRVSPRDNDYRVFLLFTQVGVKGHSCLLLCLGAT